MTKFPARSSSCRVPRPASIWRSRSTRSPGSG